MKDIEKIKIGLKTAEEFAQMMSSSDSDNNSNKNNLNDYPYIVDYIKNNKYSDELIYRFLDEENYKIDNSNKKHNISKFIKSLDATEKRKKSIRVIKYRISFAVAAAVLALSFLIYDLSSNDVANKIIANEEGIVSETPTIIFSNGENKNIGDTKLVEVSEYVNVENKHLAESRSIEKQTTNNKVEYNTILVPFMYTLDVILEDGTKVKLNANSKLKYPKKFTGSKREVFLSGEAYFDVVKGEDPFIVNTKDISVKVYGTKFNINTHKDDVVETILVSGSVGVKMLDSQKDEVKIEPNQMFIFNKKQNIYDVKDINSKMYLSWMSGYISCHKSTLGSLLRELTNWYGTEFIVDDSVDINAEITLSQSKKLPIEKLVEILENITDLTFVMDAKNKYTIINTSYKN